MSLYNKIITPKQTIIEQTAASLAATFYEVGRGQGLTSKYKSARAYARANLNKFIPKATDLLMDMLKPTSNCTEEMRNMIYEAFMERVNDPGLCEIMPNIDVKKVIKQIEIAEKKKQIVINTKPAEPKTVLHNR